VNWRIVTLDGFRTPRVMGSVCSHIQLSSQSDYLLQQNSTAASYVLMIKNFSVQPGLILLQVICTWECRFCGSLVDAWDRSPFTILDQDQSHPRLYLGMYVGSTLQGGGGESGAAYSNPKNLPLPTGSI